MTVSLCRHIASMFLLLALCLAALNCDGQTSRAFYLAVEVNTLGYARFDKPVEVELDFASFFEKLEVNTPFDVARLSLVETDSAGRVIDDDVPFQFDRAMNSDSSGNVVGTLVFLMKGDSPAASKRRFRIYYGDKTTRRFNQANLMPMVSLVDNVPRDGYESFEIRTKSATYYYDKSGSAFGSILDNDGNDWISYHPEGGPAGHFRGLPNIAFEGPGAFHPGRGEENRPTKILSQGPLRATLFSQTADSSWALSWDFYPTYAKMTLLKKGAPPYWILYEGTPGGVLDVENDYWVQSSGRRMPVKEDWRGDLPKPEWVYFGAGNSDRVLFLANHQDDPAPDQFWQMKGHMTVFGFGREYTCCGKYLTTVPAELTIGFSESGVFEEAAKTINSAYRPLSVEVGEPVVL